MNREDRVVHVGVIGPYESGKTTLCNTLHGLEKGYRDQTMLDDYRNYMSVAATIGCSSLGLTSAGGKRFLLVDTPGLERFNCIMLPVVRNCEILVVCQRLSDIGKVDYLTKNSDSLKWILENSSTVEKIIYVYTCSDKCPEKKDPEELCTSIYETDSFNVLLGVLKVEVDRLRFYKDDYVAVPVPAQSSGCC